MSAPAFKRGQRVRLTVEPPKGRAPVGTITSAKVHPYWGTVRVRWDHQRAYENGEDCRATSLEADASDETAFHFRQYNHRATHRDWLLIQDAISNSDMPEADRIRILDALPMHADDASEGERA